MKKAFGKLEGFVDEVKRNSCSIVYFNLSSDQKDGQEWRAVPLSKEHPDIATNTLVSGKKLAAGITLTASYSLGQEIVYLSYQQPLFFGMTTNKEEGAFADKEIKDNLDDVIKTLKDKIPGKLLVEGMVLP